jgi:hypothetical protein
MCRVGFANCQNFAASRSTVMRRAGSGLAGDESEEKGGALKLSTSVQDSGNREDVQADFVEPIVVV